MNKLSDISTKDLAEELSKRLGVTEIRVDAYEIKNLDIEGPAVVLVVID